MSKLVLLASLVALALAAPVQAKAPANKKPSGGGGGGSCPAICAGKGIEGKGIPDGISDKRRAILEKAATYLGEVSDCGGSDGEKKGADHLERFYRLAFGKDKKGKEVYQPNWSEKVRKPGSHSDWKGPWSWCAIYAIAAVKEAGGYNLGWATGGIMQKDGKKYPYVGGSKGIQPGDLAFWKDPPGKRPLNHHDLIESIDGDEVVTLDGNQECSGIMRKKRSKKMIAGYYKTAD